MKYIIRVNEDYVGTKVLSVDEVRALNTDYSITLERVRQKKLKKQLTNRKRYVIINTESKKREVMFMKILVTFIILSIINVIFSTIRSITTIKSGKTVASFISGGYFAFYNIMLIYTVANFPMWQKCLITFICNVIGVWIVKFCEEQMKKDKLWKVETSILNCYKEDVKTLLIKADIPFNYIEGIGKYTIFNVFCATQEQSTAVKEILKAYKAKYFVSESKTL